MLRRFSRTLVFCALAATVAICGPAAAWAHAVLLETSPADGAALEAAPAELKLVFNEPARPVFLRLIDDAGRQLLPADAVRARDATVAAPMPPLAAGTYIASWRAVSIDGHPIGGAFTFRIGAAAGEAIPTADRGADTEAGWRIASGVARFLVYGLTLLAAGGALFASLVLRGAIPRAVRAYLLVSAAGAALALVLGLGVEGGLLALGPWTAIFDPSVWRLGASGTMGASVALSLLGLALIAGGLSGHGAARPWLLLIGALVAVGGLGLTGHAATAAPRWLTAPAVVLHGLAAAFWIGAFWPLAWMLRRGPAPTAAVERFSHVAVGAVALLVLAGVALSAVQLGGIAALWSTAYGLILLAKLGAVVILLTLAGLNKWRLSPALAQGGAPAAARLRRSIRAEMALAVAVLAVTAALGTVPPPRALAERAAHAEHGPSGHDHTAFEPGYSAVVSAPPYTAQVEVSPARPGGNTITVRLTQDGAPVEPLEATIAFALPAAGIEPIARPLERTGPGTFRYTGPELSLPGRWTLRVEALVTDFRKAVFATEVPIR